MLQIKDIHKQYKTGDFVQKALDGVTLNLRDNEFVAILGPSGSGKTTLLNIIGGLDRYDAGDLVINGTSTRQYRDRDWDSYRNHTIGFVFQSYNLIPHQSILANVELALTISGIPKAQRRQRARRALAQVGLGAHVHKKPNQLSGGQMQRVAIARALVNDPDIVLADEPTGALDSDTSVQIMELLKEVARDRLVVMVTHNPELADQYATRIVNLRDGRILDDSDPYVIDETGSAPAVHRTMGRSSMSFGTAVALSFNNLKTKMARTVLTSFAGSIGIIGIALILSVSTGVNNYITAIQRDTMTAYPISIDAKSWDLQSLLEQSAANADGERTDEHDRDAVYADDSSFTQASTLTSSIAENNLTAFKRYLDDPDSEIQQYVGANGIHYSYDVKFSVVSRDPDGTLVDADGVDFGDDTGSMSSMMATKSGSMTSMSDVTAMQMSMVTGDTDENAAPSAFGEIMPGEGDGELISPVVTDNYKVVSGAWPEARDEVVLVADQNNEIPLSTLYELGLLPASDYDDLMKRLDDGEKIDEQTIRLDYDQVLNQQLYLIPACDQYVRGDDGLYSYVGDDAERMAELVDNGTAMPLRIVGVVRPVEDADAANIDGSVGYTHALTDYLIDHTNQSAVVADQQADQTRNVLNGMTFSPSDDATKVADARTYVAGLGVTQKAQLAAALAAQAAQAGMTMDTTGAGASAASEEMLAQQLDAYLATAGDDVFIHIYDEYVSTGDYDDNLSAFGVISRDAPSSIRIYCDNFEDKDGVSDAIDQYNADASEQDKITYVDYVGALMSSVTTIVNVITYVLIAFVAVSLVVSSIMIGIITYISVLERTKEIGILRAMGASKHNVSSVFNAETGMIGLCSGLIGVGVTLLLLIPGNAILHHFMGTNEVSGVLPVPGAVALVVLSVVLTLIGGIIPSKKAARQDPATALRTE
ncbi:ABC transporter ATP-binding protein/permease [uncultured Bifidobacterium sp.]|uniref:ABC transporter ATP-binding protein/permease n=2 Tax=uncultured Bifidobacterium sp. TaxID=165187 RepID=UPI0027DBF535|nr:ABC transporter ATP-binding protein/permease [uncultured Bifidobacterium sp.]